ncbi:MAG: TolC family protein [Bacteroidota bacterium]
MKNMQLMRNYTPGTYIVLTALLFMLSTFRADAQDLYNVNQCIRLGLENNFSLKIERNLEEIDVNNYTRGNAGMLPTISNTNRFGGTVNSQNQQFENGTEVTSQGVHNLTGSSSIDAGMTIFRGFQVQHTYRKLGQQKELGGLHTQMAVENLIAQIVSEYHYYVEQLTLYENLAYAVSLSRERVRIDEERYVLGGASRMQLLQSRVYLNADSSRLARQNEVLKSSQIRLNELMAAENLDAPVVLEDTLIQLSTDLSYEDLLKKTLEYNTELQIASKNQQISELDYKIIESRAYPYLNLSAGYGINYNDYQNSAIDKQYAHGLNYGVTLGIDIFDGFNRRREKANASIALANKQLRYQEIEQSVKGDLLTLFHAYQNNLQLLRLEEENLEVARENLEIALDQYKLGSLAGLELREVQKSLLDAEERLISVKYLTKVAEISLMQVSGNIMHYFE